MEWVFGGREKKGDGRLAGKKGRVSLTGKAPRIHKKKPGGRGRRATCREREARHLNGGRKKHAFGERKKTAFGFSPGEDKRLAAPKEKKIRYLSRLTRGNEGKRKKKGMGGKTRIASGKKLRNEKVKEGGKHPFLGRRRGKVTLHREAERRGPS